MIFGTPDRFAIEAIVEPGPQFPAVFASNIVGRVRAFVGGCEVGRFDEPACVLRPLTEHLASFSNPARDLWDDYLAALTPQQQFDSLDRFLFLGASEETPDGILDTVFLTNVSEAFDGVKGFILAPPGDSLHILLRIRDSAQIHVSVSRMEFEATANAFANWWSLREHELLHQEA